MCSRRKSLARSDGFTLLEVIIALAILGGAVAVLSQVATTASRNASYSRSETQAQLLATSIMNELLVGMSESNDVTRQSIAVEDTEPWVYSVIFGTTTLTGLTSVEVLVEQDLERQFNPVRYSLIRWIASVSESSTDEQQSDQQQSGSSSGSGSGGSSGA